MIHHLRTMDWKLARREFGALLIMLGAVYGSVLIAWGFSQ